MYYEYGILPILFILLVLYLVYILLGASITGHYWVKGDYRGFSYNIRDSFLWLAMVLFVIWPIFLAFRISSDKERKRQVDAIERSERTAGGSGTTL